MKFEEYGDRAPEKGFLNFRSDPEHILDILSACRIYSSPGVD